MLHDVHHVMTMSEPRTPMTPWVAIIAGGGMVVGSFLPWLQASAPFVGTISRSGLDGGGDGVVTLIAGGAAALLGLALVTGNRVPFTKVLLLLAGVVGLVIVFVDGRDVNDRVTDARSTSGLISASFGPGLIIVGIAAVVTVIVAGVLPNVARPKVAQKRRALTLAAPRVAGGPGWYPDPLHRFWRRWWDGRRWTASVAAESGEEAVDPTWTS